MKIFRSIRLFVVALAALAGVSLAFALAYCSKPVGVAVRSVAYEDLKPLFDSLKKRFGDKDKFLVIAKVPPAIQLDGRFKTIESRELRTELVNKPKFDEMARSVAKDMSIPLEQAKEEVFNFLNKPKTFSSISGDGLVYLYSNDVSILRRISPDIATAEGLVIEGTAAEVAELLAGANGDNAKWWQDNIPRDMDTVLTVGFDAPGSLTGLTKHDSKLLRVSDWSVATERNLSTLGGMFDVTPADAVVLNLFPLDAAQATPWGFNDARARSYAANGRNFKSEYERFGYAVKQTEPGATVETVMSWMTVTVLSGKKVLVLAESVVDESGKTLMRIPGVQGGISSADLLKLDDKVHKGLFIVSCNSQALSDKLPLAVVGTIYTDVAAKLVRATFASTQADSMREYLQLGLGSNSDWAATVARESLKIATVTEQPAGAAKSGFMRVATIAQVARPPAPPVLPSSPPPPVPPLPPPVPESHGWLALFLVGALGALCKEGFRWKALVEKKKARSYFQGVYLLVSAGLMLAAGAVAVFFARLVPPGNWTPIVAFVAGAGFEKIVQLAVQLKFWNPLKAVPMGGDSASSGNQRGGEDSAAPEGLAEYLGH